MQFESMRMIGQVLLLLWLAVWAVQDIRRREISCWQPIAAGVLALAGRFFGGMLLCWDMAGVIALGGLTLGLGGISGGRFGLGDGAVCLCMGLYLGLSLSLTALILALLLTVPVSLYLLVVRGRPAGSVIPFVPFLLAGTGLTLLLT